MGESKNLFEFLMGEENVNQLYILILLVVLDYITGISFVTQFFNKPTYASGHD